MHQSDTNESCESTSNNNQDQDNDVISKSASDIEPSEPGIFQIDSDKENFGEDDCSSSEVEETLKSELVKSNTPENEMELTNMMEKQTLANEETEDQDHATLVLSDRGKESTSS